MSDTFDIKHTTKDTVPAVSFGEIKDAVLGRHYELSLVCIGEKRSRTLNRTYRGKDKSTNVLSFPLDKQHGEIFLTLPLIKRQTKQFNKTYTQLVAFLFIHGLLHLKGMDHGSTMERAEKKFCAMFGY